MAPQHLRLLLLLLLPPPQRRSRARTPSIAGLSRFHDPSSVGWMMQKTCPSFGTFRSRNPRSPLRPATVTGETVRKKPYTRQTDPAACCSLSLSPMSGSTASEAQPRRWHARENCHQSAWPVAPARSPPAPPLHGPSARGTRAHEPVDPPEPRVPASASQLRTLAVVQLVGIPSELRTCCKDIPELGLCEPAAPLDNQVFNRGQ